MRAASQVRLLCLLRRLGHIEIRQQKGSKCLLVNCFCPTSGRIIHPNDRSNLDPKVERNDIDKETKETLKDGHEGKDDPVREPLRIVLATRIHGLEGLVCRIDKAYEIDNQFSTTNECKDSSDQQKESDKEESLGLARLSF